MWFLQRMLSFLGRDKKTNIQVLQEVDSQCSEHLNKTFTICLVTLYDERFRLRMDSVVGGILQCL